MRYLFILLLFLLSILCSASTKSAIKKLHEKVYSLLESDLEAAMFLTDSSLLLAQEANLDWEEANSLYIRGYIFDEKGEFSKAVIAYLKSALLLDNLEHEKAAITHTSVLLNVGAIFKKYYKYNESIEFLDKGIKISEEWGFEKQELKLLYNKASALFFQKQLDQSVTVLDRAIALAINQQDGHRIVKCWNLLGLIHYEKGLYALAKVYYQNIIQSTESTTKDMALAFYNLGNVYQAESYSDSSKLSYEASYKVSIDARDLKTQFIALHALAELFYQNKQFKEAKSYGLKAKKLYSKTDGLPEHFALFHHLHLIYAGINQFEIASSYSSLYYDESQRFYEEMKLIMQAKDEFHMDLLLAGIKAEEQAKLEQQYVEIYRWLTIMGVFIIVLILITWKVWFSWWRRNLWNKIYHVFKTKNPDGSYKEIPFEGID